MSAFLGPIHYWMYGKMQFQEGLTQAILQAAAQRGWGDTWTQRLDAACGPADLRPLEESIDLGNIHGWLHGKIDAVEARFAVLVTELLREDPSRLDALADAAFRFGQAHAIGGGADAEGALKALDDLLLDGMPCDRVNEVVEQTGDKILWQRTRCVHREHWDRAGGDVAVYYTLRAQVIRGMLDGSGLRYLAGENGLSAIETEESACTA